MGLDLLEQEIKKHVEFLETRYYVYAWKLTDDDLHNFLAINKEAFFKEAPATFYVCMIEYFDCLFDQVMADNCITINKEYLLSHMYYLQLIFNKNCVKADVYDIVDDLKILYGLDKDTKTLTKNI